MVQKTPPKRQNRRHHPPSWASRGSRQTHRAKGGIPYYIPAIEIKGLSNPEPVKKFIAELAEGQVDYVILMSTNGVKYLFRQHEDLKQTSQLHEGLAKSFVIAVGPKTAEAMKEYNVRVDLVPQKYSSEGLLES